MSINYSNYPKAETPYVAHLVPYRDLVQFDRTDADARFNGTFMCGKRMDDFLYLCAPQGGVIGRKLK